jgi:polysaccharide chain length determinant protein (PEP-CTERM system associated)
VPAIDKSKKTPKLGFDSADSLYLLARGMWRQRWKALQAAWLVALLGGGLIAMTDERYEATSRVFVDTQTVLRPLMAGLTVQPDVDRQVGMLARTLITRPTIEELVRRGAIATTMTPLRREQFIDRLVRDIRVTGSARDNIYNISYRDQDQARALAVVEGLVSIFVERGVGESQRDTDEAQSFIDGQIASYERQLEEAENRLKNFKVKNIGYIGTGAGQDYFSRSTALSEEITKLRSDLRAAEQSREALRRQLSGEELFVPTETFGIPAAPSETDVRLETQRRQLDEMRRRYTENHPEVIATQRAIATLEAHRRQEQEVRPKQSDRPLAPNNPVVQKIKIAMAEAEANAASLRSRLQDLQARYDQLRSAATRAPQVEAELAQLNRDYEVLRKNYEALVARRESAKIGREVDRSHRLADFRQIEPPRLLPRPVFPSRAMLIVALLAVSIAAGFGVALVLARVAPTVIHARQLRGYGLRPVLGSIGLYPDPDMKQRLRRANFAFGASVMSLFVFAGASLAWVISHVGG